MSIQNLRYADPKNQNKPATVPAQSFNGLQSFKRMIEGMSKNQQNINALENFEPEDEAQEYEQQQQGARQEYLDSLERSKQTLRERTPFLMDTPEKPEMDKERFKNYKNLTKAGALAQLIDAVGDIAMGAKNADYRPVANTTGGEVAIQGANQLYTMDANQRKALGDYKDQVFEIGQANAQSKHATDRLNADLSDQTDAYNAGIDAQKAQARLGYLNKDEEQKRLDKELEEKYKLEEEREYIQMGHRLVSQGKIEKATEAYKKAGLDMTEIQAAQSVYGSGKGGERTRTVIDYYNDYLGRGEDESVSNIELRMLDRFRELEKTMSKDTNSHYSAGEPISPQAKEYEDLKESLGNLRFAPGKEELLKIYGQTPGVERDQDGKVKPLADLNEVHGKEVVDAALGGKVEPLGAIDLSDPESRAKYEAYDRNMAIAFDNAETNPERMAILEQAEQDLKQAGFPEDQLEQIVFEMFGLEEGGEESEEQPQVSEEQPVTEPMGNATPGQDAVEQAQSASEPKLTESQKYFDELKTMIDQGIISKERLNKESPGLSQYMEDGNVPDDVFIPQNMRIEPNAQDQFDYLKKAVENGELTLDQVAEQYSPNLALLIQKGRDLPGSYKVNDWFN